jgi:hypothetical protein
MERKAVIIEKGTDKKKAHIRNHLIPKGYDMAVCTGCHLIYKESRWFYDDKLYSRSVNEKTTHKVTCPACIKTRDDYPDGIIVLSGKFLLDRIDEIKRIVSNEERGKRDMNPFNRIIKMTNEKDRFVISFTKHKFAEKIAKSIRRAFKAELTFNWSEGEDYVEITCRRDK